MARAIIKLKGKKSDPAKIFTIKRVLISDLKKRGFSIPVAMLDKTTLSVPIGLPRKQLEIILGHIDIPYSIEYVDDEKTVTVSESKIPADYGLLKGKVRKLTEKVEKQRLDIGQLEQTLAEETQIRMSIRAELDNARATYKELLGAEDFVSENMLRENVYWNTFVNFYTDTLEHASEIYDIPIDVLEREVLTFSSLQERKDFKDMEVDLENAKAAKESAEKNPLLKMNPYAQQVLNKMAKIEKRQDIINELRRELGAQIGGKRKKMWIVLSTENKETLLTLPFTYNPSGQYHVLEQPLIEAINQSLTDSKMEYTQQEANGLLRYVIPRMKPRARARLDKTISSTEDPFVRLCGIRRVVGIN